ncbi:MAG: glycosyltransferase family 2 protein [Kiritimatiellae bacterium]|nr:glycosyltransferase family 2 protein [Kiritimatiellia bacterium]
MSESDPKRVLVIIPCRNEEGRIGPVVRSVRERLSEADVVVINDDSTDRSAEEALAAGATVLPHTVNLGYGAALETGYKYAMGRRYDIVLQMDGDGQHPADELPRLIQPVSDGRADLVIGSRYLNPDTHFPTSFARRVGQMVFAAAVFLFTRRRFSDPTSGFQALSKRATTFFASGFFPCDYPDADVLLMSHLAGLRMMEIPVRMLPREDGRSMHSGLSCVYYVMKMLLSMFIVLLNFHEWRRIRHDHA